MTFLLICVVHVLCIWINNTAGKYNDVVMVNTTHI